MMCKSFDSYGHMHMASGEHTRKCPDEDTRALAEQLKLQKLFTVAPGKFYNAFPTYPENLFVTIDYTSVKEWMKEKWQHFRKINIYSRLTT